MGGIRLGLGLLCLVFLVVLLLLLLRPLFLQIGCWACCAKPRFCFGFWGGRCRSGGKWWFWRWAGYVFVFVPIPVPGLVFIPVVGCGTSIAPGLALSCGGPTLPHRRVGDDRGRAVACGGGALG